MGQIHPGFIADMLKHCERGERPPLTVWEAQQLLTLAQRALAAPPQGASSGWKLVPAWKLRRAAEILDRDGDEYGIAADLRSMLAAPPAPQEPAAGWKLLKDSTFEERSWQEDAGHENGNYMCDCHHCLRTFLGHKRRVTCKVCASPAPGELGAVASEGWISVDDRMPEPDSGEVLVWLSGGRCAFDEWHMHREDPTGMSTTYTMEMGLMWRDYEFEDITHWMPLPQPPQQAPSSAQGSGGKKV